MISINLKTEKQSTEVQSHIQGHIVQSVKVKIACKMSICNIQLAFPLSQMPSPL